MRHKKNLNKKIKQKFNGYSILKAEKYFSLEILPISSKKYFKFLTCANEIYSWKSKGMSE